MSTPWFDKLDRADDWLAKVSRAVGRRVMAAGPGNWNRDPCCDQARERSANLLVRAAKRRDREIASTLAAARTVYPAPAAEGIVRTRLRDRSEVRTSRTLARYR